MIWKLLLLFIGLIYSTLTHASDFGLDLSGTLIPGKPSHLEGYRAGLLYQPDSFIWPFVSIYFDASVGHWWVAKSYHHSLNTMAIAPYLRRYFFKSHTFSPFAEASIGLSYMTRTRLANKNLGAHFNFQDQLGLGIAYGKEQRLWSILSFIHYSNGSLCHHNSGMTVPVILNIGYRF